METGRIYNSANQTIDTLQYNAIKLNYNCKLDLDIKSGKNRNKCKGSWVSHGILKSKTNIQSVNDVDGANMIQVCIWLNHIAKCLQEFTG